jgi:hypothetical protein
MAISRTGNHACSGDHFLSPATVVGTYIFRILRGALLNDFRNSALRDLLALETAGEELEIGQTAAESLDALV